jgi:hypothetical protein
MSWSPNCWNLLKLICSCLSWFFSCTSSWNIICSKTFWVFLLFNYKIS